MFIRCRLLSRALAVFILAQLPEGDPPKVRTTPNAPGQLLLTSASTDRSVSQFNKITCDK